MSSLRFLTGQGGSGFLGGAAGYFIAQTAQAVLGAVGQAAQGTQMMGNPQAYLPQLQSPSNPHDVTQDQVLQQHMQQQGAFNTALAPLKFLENIPLVGAFTKLAEDATGLSQAIANQQLAITQATEGHMRLVAANDQYAAQLLRMSGQPTAAADVGVANRLTMLKRDAAQSGAPIDQAMFDKAEQAEYAQLYHDEGVRNAGLFGLNTSGQASLSQAEGYRLRAARNEPRALLYEQQADQLRLERERRGAMAEAAGDPVRTEMLGREFAGRQSALDARQGLQTADLNRSFTSNESQLAGAANSAWASASFDQFGARREQLRAAWLPAMLGGRSDRERAAISQSFSNQWDATDFEEYHAVSNANDFSHARVGAAHLEAGMFRGEAGRLVRFVGGMQAAERLPPGAREAARQAVQAENDSAGAQIHRSLSNSGAELDMRRLAAQDALRFNDDPTVGNVDTQLGRMRLELANSDPRLLGATRATVIAEARALQHQTLGVHSGGFAQQVGAQDVAGDPIEQARMEAERKVMANRFASFIDDAGKIKTSTPGQQDSQLAQKLGDLIPVLKQWVDKMGPWAMVH